MRSLNARWFNHVPQSLAYGIDNPVIRVARLVSDRLMQGCRRSRSARQDSFFRCDAEPLESRQYLTVVNLSLTARGNNTVAQPSNTTVNVYSNVNAGQSTGSSVDAAPASQQMDIASADPTVSISGVTEATLGEPYELGLSATYPEGDSQTISSWTITWGDGRSTTFTNDNNPPASSTDTYDAWNSSHAYTAAGNYTVTAVAQDSSGNAYQPEAPIALTEVEPPPAVSSLTISANPSVGNAVIVSATAASYVGSDDLGYQWTMTDSANPANSFVKTTDSPAINFMPEDAGAWAATLIVTDNTTAESSSVGPQGFNVGTVKAIAIDGPEVLAVGNSAEYSAVGVTGVPTWTLQQGSTNSSETSAQFEFTPSEPGNYVVSVASDGSSTSTTVTVTAPNQNLSISGATVGFYGQPMTFTAELDNAPTGSAPLFMWTLLNGDGTPYSGDQSSSPSESLGTFTSPSDLPVGDYAVRLSANTTSGGATSTSSAEFDFSVLPGSSIANSIRAGSDLQTTDSVYPAEWQYMGDDDQAISTDAMVREPDGHVLVAVDCPYNAVDNEELIAFNPDLSINRSFGTNGLTYISGVGLGRVFAMALTPDGNNVIIVGDSANTWYSDGNYPNQLLIGEYAIATYQSKNGLLVTPGMPNPDFNGGNLETLGDEGDSIDGTAVAIEPMTGGSYDILVGGAIEVATNSSPGAYGFFLSRFNAAGAIDDSFGSAGDGLADQPTLPGLITPTPFSQDSQQSTAWTWAGYQTGDAEEIGIQSISVLSTGNVLIGGYYQPSASALAQAPTKECDIALAEYTPGGELYGSFGTGGVTITTGQQINGDSGTPANAQLDAMTVLSDNSILVGGGVVDLSQQGPQDAAVFLAHYSAAGLNESVVKTTTTENDALYALKSAFTFEGTVQEVGVGYRPYTYSMSFVDSTDSLNGTLLVSLENTDANGAQSWTVQDLEDDTGAVNTAFGNSGTLTIPQPAGTAVRGVVSSGCRPNLVQDYGGELYVGGELFYQGTATWGATQGPMVVTYETTPQLAASDLGIIQQSDGSNLLTWTNDGEAPSYFAVYRWPNSAYLGTPESLIATVDGTQASYDDEYATVGTTYLYTVVPVLTTAAGSTVSGTGTNDVQNSAAAASTFSTPVERDLVNIGGQTGHTNIILSRGQSYLVVVEGDIHLDGDYTIDANGIQLVDDPLITGNTINGASAGILLNGQQQTWEEEGEGSHVYYDLLRATANRPLSFQLGIPAGLQPYVGPQDTPLTIQVFEAGGQASQLPVAQQADTLCQQLTLTPGVSGPNGSDAAPILTEPLQEGGEYLIEVSGEFSFTALNPSGLDYKWFAGEAAAYLGGDSEYLWVGGGPEGQITVLKGTDADYGVEITGEGATPAIVIPESQSPHPFSHVYDFLVQGTGTPLDITFNIPGGLEFGPEESHAKFEVSLYQIAAPALSAAPQVDVVSRMSLATADSTPEGGTTVIEQSTPINLISAAADGSAVPWAVSIVSASGVWTTLASGASAGVYPSTAVTIATLVPAFYADGNYTLTLSSSAAEPQSTIVESIPVELWSAAKAGSFTQTFTDATVQSPVGSLAVTRTYDSGRLNQDNQFGPGWSLDLIDTHLSISSTNDQYDSLYSLDTLRAGDLISLDLPDGSHHVFEFAPMRADEADDQDQSPESNLYVPRFVAVDGSGATLMLQTAGAVSIELTYDRSTDEFIWQNTMVDSFGLDGLSTPIAMGLTTDPPDGISEISVDSSGGAVVTPDFMFEVTESNGTSYGINASSGAVESISNQEGAIDQLDYDAGYVLVKSQDGATLIRINETAGQITSIVLDNGTTISYSYQDGNLVEVQQPDVSTTRYTYSTLGEGGTQGQPYLTGIIDAQNAVVEQIGYSTEDQELESITNAHGDVIPVSSVGLGADEILQTSADPDGNVTEEVVDQEFGNVLRTIDVVPGTGGSPTQYNITAAQYDYVRENDAVFSSGPRVGVTVLESVETFAPFVVLGPDPAGLRFSEMPAAGTWSNQVKFDTSDNPTDEGSGCVIEKSVRVSAAGALMTTLYGQYVSYSASLQDPDFWQGTVIDDSDGTSPYAVPVLVPLVKAQETTIELQTPDSLSATGFDNAVQSITYNVYDASGNQIDALTSVGRDVPGDGVNAVALPGGFSNLQYLQLSGITDPDAVGTVLTLQWRQSSYGYEWTDPNVPYYIGISLLDLSASSRGGGATPVLGDSWEIDLTDDRGTKPQSGIQGVLANQSFDGTPQSLQALLNRFAGESGSGGNPYFSEQWNNQTVTGTSLGIHFEVPGWVAEGTQNVYASASDTSHSNGYTAAGSLEATQSVFVDVTADGTFDPNTIQVLGTTAQSFYYGQNDYELNAANTAYVVKTPGASYGEAQYSINAAGQETYYAYNAAGQTALQYTFEQWTAPNGTLDVGWVGTTSLYDSEDRLTDTYSATYLVRSGIKPEPGVNEAEATLAAPFILPVIDGGSAGVQVDTNPNDATYVTLYNAIVHTQHTDYNNLGQRVDTIDEYGGVTKYMYDAEGNTIETVNPDGTETLSVYDADNRVIWQTNTFDPATAATEAATAITTQTTYNALGEVTQTVQYSGELIVLGSERVGSSMWPQTSVLATDGTPVLGTGQSAISTTQNFYNAAGKVIETINPSGLSTGSIYYPDGTVEYTGPLNAAASKGGWLTVDGSSGVSDYAFSLSDFQQDSSTGYTTTLPDQYDPTLNLFYTESIDQNGHATETYTDVLGRTVRMVYADGSFAETLYSIDGSDVTIDAEGENVTGPDPAIPVGGYEEVSIAQRKAGDAPVITYDLYNAAGELTDVWLPAVLDANPADSQTTYGQMVEPHWTYVYDTAGNEIAQVSPQEQAAYQSWVSSGSGWSQANGVWSFTPPSGVTWFGYDQNGNQVLQVLPDGEMQTWTFDAYGNNITHKYYSATNQTTALQTTIDTYDYSAAHGGRLLQEDRYAADVNPGTSVAPNERSIYTYDDSSSLPVAEQTDQGNLAEVDDYVLQNGNLVLSTYTHYTYDPLSGNQASITTPEGTIHYVYDEATGNLIETWTGTSHTAAQNDILYGYNTQGQMASVTQVVLNGSTPPPVSGSRYDADGNELSTTSPTTLYTYDAAGNLLSVLDPNGQQTGYSYNALDELTNEQVTNTNTNEPLFAEHTDWYNDGQKQDVIDTRYNADGSVFSQITYAWTYDADARLTGETLSVQQGAGNTGVPAAYTNTFGYDLDNNRTKEDIAGGDGVSGGSNIRYSYDGDDELTDEKETVFGGSTVYETIDTYLNGNLSTQTTTGENASSSTYGYDLRNRMTSVTTGGQTTTYAYDHTGVLIAETTGGVGTYYLNDPINATGYSKPIQQSSTPGGSPTLSYVLGLSVEAQSDSTNGTLYLLSDGHGSTRALTTSTGAIAPGQTFDYNAFGTALDFDPATASTVWLFGGDGSQDNASGFTYQLARWRNGFEFTQRDTQAGSNGSPISLGSYLYSGDNAVYGNDPTGHDELSDLGIDTGADDTENDGGDGDLADQAFGLANEDIAEDEAGYDAVDSYVHGQFGNIGAYTAMNFAANDLLAAGTSVDAQAGMITAGMTAAGAVGGVLLEGGVEAFLAADEGAGGGGAEGVEDMEEVAEEQFEASADCGTENGCFLAGTDVLLGTGTEDQIQDITVGQRVATDGGVANSPTGAAAADPSATAIKNPKNWREITLVASDWDVQTLEPLSWITSHHVLDGSRIKLSNFLDLKEMGAPANLVGTVEGIGTCPAIVSGSGRVVLTTVNHLNDDVYELTLKNAQGQTETIGTTGTHPFYDVTSGWMQVQDLHVDDLLRGADGTLTVAAITRQPGTDRVYNMTVEADHVYYVGDLPALVHNTCNPLRANMEENGTQFGENEEAHHIVAQRDMLMQDARDLLDDYDIDIHDPVNGVPVDEIFHQVIHSGGVWEEYAQVVTQIIENAAEQGGRGGIIDALQGIGRILSAGGLP